MKALGKTIGSALVGAIILLVSGDIATAGPLSATERQQVSQPPSAGSAAREESLRRLGAMIRSGIAARHAGDNTKSEELLSDALALARQILPATDLGIAICLDELAKVYYNRGEMHRAEPMFREALKVAEEAEGPISIAVADVLGDLGATYRQEGRYSEAQKAVERSLSLRLLLLEPDDLRIGASYRNLAHLFDEQNRFDEAEEAANEALRLFQRALGTDSEPASQMRSFISHLESRRDGAAWLRRNSILLSLSSLLLLPLAAILTFLSEWPEAPPQIGQIQRYFRFAATLFRWGVLVAIALGVEFFVLPRAIDLIAPIDRSEKITRDLGRIGFFVGLLPGMLIVSVLFNVARWRLGWALVPMGNIPWVYESVLRADWERSAGAGPSIGGRGSVSAIDALVVGELWVNVSAGIVFILLALLPGAFLFALGLLPESDALPIIVGVGVTSIFFAFVGSALCWCVVLPRWRLWAMRSTTDWPLLKAVASEPGSRTRLMWRDDSFWSRLEIKTARQAAEQDALEAEWALRPSLVTVAESAVDETQQGA